ncbi:MAG TPA: YggS family pyridoxal phosphate-dependent enzyme [Lentimicrobium sp.]|nr:YggS family pyridoxal phosphate-dependent enzyme [Lentimicrobium sp.]
MKGNLIDILKNVPGEVTLIAVSKTRTPGEILEVYNQGIREFGENKVQELLNKQKVLPSDIKWHLIGHLQTNKIKSIIPFTYLIQSVDSLKLLIEIDKQAKRINRIVNCLLQIYIAEEESKYGLDFNEAEQIITNYQKGQFTNVNILGFMGMATFTNNINQIKSEFRNLKSYFDLIKSLHFSDNPEFSILSMGMSGDYLQAIEEGSNMIRIGTAIFGERDYKKM